MIPALGDLFDAIDGTWPARRQVRRGNWVLREGDGGGKRVSAASALGPATPDDIAEAERAMRDMGQAPLFMLRPGEAPLDDQLAARGYALVDPVTVHACAADLLTDIPIPRVTVFDVWEPLAIMNEIWARGGIGPARLRVMARAAGPKTAFLCRLNEKPAGVAFAAIHERIAMVHALEILPHQQRHGAGAWIMRAAAFWAARQGAATLAVMCTDANVAANGLYRALGFSVAGHYHYRMKSEETT